MSRVIAEAATAERSANMARIRCRDTKPELALRGALRAAGLTGYRKNLKGVPGTPDVAYTRYKLAVFVDGDFWHGRTFDAKRDRLASGHNGAYWTSKIEANMARDRRTEVLLAEAGWTVLRLWGSDVLKDPEAAASAVGKPCGGPVGRYRRKERIMKDKDCRSEAEILFAARAARAGRDADGTHPGTTFAGTGPVCDKSLTPDPAKAERLRTQKYW